MGTFNSDEKYTFLIRNEETQGQFLHNFKILGPTHLLMLDVKAGLELDFKESSMLYVKLMF